MAISFESTKERECGTIVSWNAMGMGRIRADNGDSIRLFYWSVLRGFRQLGIGQRCEFSLGIGLNQNVASLVTALPSDDGSD
jgi:cold shock CspA family protein